MYSMYIGTTTMNGPVVGECAQSTRVAYLGARAFSQPWEDNREGRGPSTGYISMYLCAVSDILRWKVFQSSVYS